MKKVLNNSKLYFLAVMLISISLLIPSITVYSAIDKGELIYNNESGSARGKVVDMDTNSVIPNAEISINELDICINTDENGEFSISGLPIGQYTWEVKAKGYGKTTFEAYPIGYLGATIFAFPVTKDKKGYYSKHEICESSYNDVETHKHEKNHKEKMDIPNYAVPQEPPVIPSTLKIYYNSQISSIALDTYLKNVVPNEINPLNPLYKNMTDAQKLNMLKAQAIAARSYAVYHYYKKDRHSGQGYDCCSGQHCQVYNPNVEYEISTQAVNETSKKILIYVKDSYNWIYEYVDAAFFASCKGQTKNSEDVWGGYLPYLRSTTCPYDIRPTYETNHGLGMCQDGAAGYALNNFSHMSILTHYYTGVKIIDGQY